jgi:hypothetical protein
MKMGAILRTCYLCSWIVFGTAPQAAPASHECPRSASFNSLAGLGLGSAEAIFYAVATNTTKPQARVTGLDVNSRLIPVRPTIVKFQEPSGDSESIHVHRICCFPDGAIPTLAIGQISM